MTPDEFDAHVEGFEEPREGIDCPECGIELGEGRNQCKRAKGSDLCFECAIDDERRNERMFDERAERMHDDPESFIPYHQTEAFAQEMRDAGRGHLVRGDC